MAAPKLGPNASRPKPRKTAVAGDLRRAKTLKVQASVSASGEISLATTGVVSEAPVKAKAPKFVRRLYACADAMEDLRAWGMVEAYRGYRIRAYRLEGQEIPGWPAGTVAITGRHLRFDRRKLARRVVLAVRREDSEDVAGILGYLPTSGNGEFTTFEGTPIRSPYTLRERVVGLAYFEEFADGRSVLKTTFSLGGLAFDGERIVRLPDPEFPAFTGKESDWERMGVMEAAAPVYAEALRQGETFAVEMPEPEIVGILDEDYPRLPRDLRWFEIKGSGIFPFPAAFGFRELLPDEPPRYGAILMEFDEERHAAFVGAYDPRSPLNGERLLVRNLTNESIPVLAGPDVHVGRHVAFTAPGEAKRLLFVALARSGYCTERGDRCSVDYAAKGFVARMDGTHGPASPHYQVSDAWPLKRAVAGEAGERSS